jgi:hypothetical protein
VGRRRRGPPRSVTEARPSRSGRCTSLGFEAGPTRLRSIDTTASARGRERGRSYRRNVSRLRRCRERRGETERRPVAVAVVNQRGSERERLRERERKHARVLVRKRGKAVWAGVDSIYPWACFNRGGENFLLLETWALVALRTTTFLFLILEKYIGSLQNLAKLTYYRGGT